MAAVPTLEGLASAFSLLLAALATLRAASRLEHRLGHRGALGLMEGPPILGPTARRRRTDGTTSDHAVLVDDDGRRHERGEDTSQIAVEASPLWEHTEAFRRAVVLGLLCDDDAADDGTINALFADITRNDEGDSINVRGGSEEDLAIAAAVEAGLLLPSSARGGGAYAARRQRQKRRPGEDGTGSSSSHPLAVISSWLVRELTAPLAALPAWHGLLCSHLRAQKEVKWKESEWCLLTPWERVYFLLRGKRRGENYDPTGLDFDVSLSAAARVPRGDDEGGRDGAARATHKAVQVKAFAPHTFRELRNKCFRMTESEYARSILGAMNGRPPITITDTDAYNDDAATMRNVLQEITGGKERKENRRRRHLPTLPYISFQSNSKGAARAGTFFFFTADGAFMIKTVKKEEAKAFLEMLPEYHRFMSNGVNRRNSLLTRVFGMYAVRFPAEADSGARWEGGRFSSPGDSAASAADEERVYLVMHSVFPAAASAFVTERFDLKGSTAGRACAPEERRTQGAHAVLKDLDLQREVEECKDAARGLGRTASRYGLCVGRRRKTALLAQLERDVDFLRRCNVLDYSLLVGVADMESSNGSIGPKAADKRGVPQYLANVLRWMDFPMPYYGAGTTAVDGGALSSLPGQRNGKRVTYYLGVIDFLQPWTVKKRLERDLKGLAGFDKAAISCAAPADYAERFLTFADAHIT